MIFGAGQWINGARLGRVGRCWSASLLLGLRAAAVVPRRDRRERGRPVRRAHRRLVPLEHELVHLLGGDVLRRVLRRAVLGARCTRCRPSATSTTRILWPDFKAVWPSVGAGLHGSPAGIVEPFATMGPWPIPTINTALLLTSGVTLTIAHHALIANQRAQDDRLHVDHGAARHHLPRLPGLRVHARLQRPEPKLSSGIYGSTFFMLTGFHGFHVFVGMLMLLFITLRLHARPLHAGAPLRLRRRGLVLALRRRGLARPVRRGLLALSRSAADAKRRARRSVVEAQRGRSATPVGWIQPSVQASRMNRNSATDSATRTRQCARHARRRCGLAVARPPRSMNTPALASAARMPSSATTIRHLHAPDYRRTALPRRAEPMRRDAQSWLRRCGVAAGRWPRTARLGVWQLDRARAEDRAAGDARRARAAAAAATRRSLARDAAQPRRAAPPARRAAGPLARRAHRLPRQPADGRPAGLLRRHAAAARRTATRCWCSAAGLPRDFADAHALPRGRRRRPARCASRAASPRAPPRLFEFAAAASGPIRQNLDLAAFARETGLALRPLSRAAAGRSGRAADGLLRALAARRPPTCTSTTATPFNGSRSRASSPACMSGSNSSAPRRR